jgi:hypothetical protein
MFTSKAAVKGRVGVASDNLLNILLREFLEVLWYLSAAFSRSSGLISCVLVVDEEEEEEEEEKEESGADEESSLVRAEA